VSFTSKELRAIRRHADDEDMVPQLSVYPGVNMKRRTGSAVPEKFHIKELVELYETKLKQDRKARQAAKRNERR
jgi:hypothetical protein